MLPTASNPCRSYKGTFCGLVASNNDMAWQRTFPPGFQDMLEFGFIEALTGRRARRFFMGAEIPDGVLAYKSIVRAHFL